jgi:porphobilinogen synthase
MTTPPLAPYPATRLRRVRQADWTRRLVRETEVRPSDLIWSMVVHEGEGTIPVASMPGVERLSVKEAAKAAVRARDLGIPAIAIFPHIDGSRKDATGSIATDPDGVIPRAVKAMKDAAPEVGIMCDVALDPFTDHGHDGVIGGGKILNDPTIERLIEQGMMQAEAGADILAPSDMMDGRIGKLRAALEGANFQDTMIMSYAAKYASAFYGPYRDAIGSAKLAGGPNRGPTRRPTRWTRPTPRRPSARSRSTSPRAPTWSWSSRACRISTSCAAWSTSSACRPTPSRCRASTR